MRCALCDARLLEGGDWIGLNRMAVGIGKDMRWLSFSGRERGYHWDMDKKTGSGTVLCWPHCAMTYIEGMHIEMGYDIKTGRHG